MNWRREGDRMEGDCMKQIELGRDWVKRKKKEIRMAGRHQVKLETDLAYNFMDFTRFFLRLKLY